MAPRDPLISIILFAPLATDVELDNEALLAALANMEEATLARLANCEVAELPIVEVVELPVIEVTDADIEPEEFPDMPP